MTAGAGAVAVRARRARLRTAAASPWLDLSFLLVILVMTAHEAEHVAQVLQKDTLQNSCPVFPSSAATRFPEVIE